jgi:hypothetical protein
VGRELCQHCLLLVLKCIGVHCKKRLAIFPSPSRDVTYQTLPGLAGNN